MNSTHSNRKLAALFAAALAALAVLALPSMAAAKHRDRNHDRIPDRWEKRHHLSLAVNQAGRDQDGDQLRNRGEFLAGDDPRDRDSDDDGVMDGEENAGTVASFDAATGKLTIALFGGDTASGLVTDQTRIECEGEHSSATTSSDGSESEQGDDDGGQGHEAGDDHGEEAESGDGSGGDNSGPGSQSSGPGGGDDGGTCSTANLVVGAVVDEAELELDHGVAIFEKVELAG
jgi:hypothetical protein